MSFQKRRLSLVGLLATVALLLIVSLAYGRQTVPPVSNLHIASGTASQVTLQWDAPSQNDLHGTTVDSYVIKRNGRTIGTLNGFQGIVATSYVDASPSPKAAVYSVIAVDSNGDRSPPVTVDVPAPQSAATTPQPSSGPPDVIQSSGLCDAIIPPDIRGNNRPTPLEEYGCGQGMDTVNDSTTSTLNFLIFSVNKPRLQHDFFQSVLIQIPEWLGQTFFLLISALSIWALQAATYLGVAKSFASILQVFHGSPNYSGLLALATAGAIGFIGLHLIRGQVRRAHESGVIIALALGVLAIFLSNPFRSMQYVVEKPIGVYSGITNQVTDLVAGTDVSKGFNLTANPTYAGNSTNNAIRKSENVDFLIWQYVPQCAVNFRDFQWAMNHDVPGTQTSFCERFLQIWDKNNNGGQQKQFIDQLRKANKDVASFFYGNDQMTRVGYEAISKFALTIHNVIKAIIRLAVIASMMILLGEVSFGVLWLLYAITSSDNSKLAAERWMGRIFHWLKLPAIMLVIGLVQQAVEAYIVTDSTGSGFLWLTWKAIIWELITLYGTFKAFRAVHRNYKLGQERLGALRSASHGIMRSGLALAALGAGSGAALEALHQRHRDDRRSGGTYASAEPASAETFDYYDFRPSDRPQLATSGGPRFGGGDSFNPTSPGGGRPPYDAEGVAEEMSSLELPMATGHHPSGGESNGQLPDRSSDGPIYDADVVDDEPQKDE